MIKAKYLNNIHKQLIDKYLKDIQEVMFYITEDMDRGRFHKFNNILINVTKYSNDFKEDDKGEVFVNEWIYMIPNLTYYSVLGFLAGITTKHNIDEIADTSEVVLKLTTDLIGKSTDILEEFENKIEIEEKC